MLNRLFKAKWQHQDPDIRLQSLDHLSWAKQSEQEVLVKLASSDAEQRVRRAAIVRIPEKAILQQLLTATVSADDWVFLGNHLATQFPETVESLADEFRQNIDKWDTSTKKSLFNEILSADLMNLLVKDIQSNELLTEILLNSKVNSARLVAVEKIDDISILQHMLKSISEKQINHAIRAKIKLDKALHNERLAVIELADKQLSALQKLARLPWDAQYEYKVANIVEKWQAFDLDLLGDRVVHYDSALEQCQQTITAHKKTQVEQDAEQAVHNKQRMLLEQLHRLSNEIKSENQSSHHALRDAVNLIEKNWQQVIQESSASPALNAQYSELKFQLLEGFKYWDKFEQLIPSFYDLFEKNNLQGYSPLRSWCDEWKALNEQLKWPKDIARPGLLNDWYAQADTIQKEFKTTVDKQNKKIELVIGKFKLLQRHINEKNLIAANKLMNFIQHKMTEIHPDFVTRLQPRLEKLTPQLEELRDWHAFATTPKKVELCEAMEALAEKQQKPLKRAEVIKKLQHQWHELIASDSNADDQLWERFKQASDIAFQPCQAYYAEQDKLKEQNLQHRLQLCEKLEQVVAQTDWQQVDWKALDKLQQSSLAEWQKYAPVPDKLHKPAKKRFDEIHGKIGEQLKQEKQRNLDLRIDLVERAEKLVEMEELDKSIELAIGLQQQWKQIGLTFFKAEKLQWKAFRKILDKVFARRDEAKNRFVTELAENDEKLKLLTIEIRALSDMDDPQLRQSSDEFERLFSSWDNSLKLPRSSAKKSLDQFYSACDHYRQKFAGIEGRLREQSVISLNALLDSLHRAEINLLQGEKPDVDPLRAALSDIEFYADLKDISFRNAIQLRVDKIENLSSAAEVTADNLNSTEQAQSLIKAEALILQAEILAGVDSPAKYKQQRMALQLQQLQKGLTAQQSQFEIQSELISIYQQWVAISFIPEDEYPQLVSRLALILKKYSLFK